MFPLPPSIEKKNKDGELDIDEYGFILESTLREVHRKDKLIIAFIESFIRCKSIAQASAECGIHRSEGYKWRHRKDISNCIQKLVDKSTIKHGFDATEILERVKEIVDFDPIDLQNPDGSFKSNLFDVPPEARRSLKELVVKNLWGETEDLNGIKSKIIIGEIISYKFYDKLKGAELVGKEKNMFKTTTRHEHTITKDMQNILLGSIKRAEKQIEDKHTIVEAEFTSSTEGE